MTELPERLAAIVADMATVTDRQERAELLIEMADRFDTARVPSAIATKPYPEDHRVPACESDAFVWTVDQPDGTLTYWFDVLNPQGLSAMAMCVILKETLDGVPLAEVAQVTPDIVPKIFGRELTMGKGIGVSGIVTMVVYQAKQRLKS